MIGQEGPGDNDNDESIYESIYDNQLLCGHSKGDDDDGDDKGGGGGTSRKDVDGGIGSDGNGSVGIDWPTYGGMDGYGELGGATSSSSILSSYHSDMRGAVGSLGVLSNDLKHSRTRKGSVRLDTGSGDSTGVSMTGSDNMPEEELSGRKGLSAGPGPAGQQLPVGQNARTTVGDYSKWQRQKHKAMIGDSVSCAKELCDELQASDEHQRVMFETMRDRRTAMCRISSAFLHTWFSGGDMPAAATGVRDHPSVEALADEEIEVAVPNVRYGFFCTPKAVCHFGWDCGANEVLSAFFRDGSKVPSTSKLVTGIKEVRRHLSYQHVKYQIIGHMGTNVVENLLVKATPNSHEPCFADGNKLFQTFTVQPMNAELCGVNSFAMKGFMTCTFTDEPYDSPAFKLLKVMMAYDESGVQSNLLGHDDKRAVFFACLGDIIEGMPGEEETDEDDESLSYIRAAASWRNRMPIHEDVRTHRAQFITDFDENRNVYTVLSMDGGAMSKFGNIVGRTVQSNGPMSNEQLASGQCQYQCPDAKPEMLSSTIAYSAIGSGAPIAAAGSHVLAMNSTSVSAAPSPGSTMPRGNHADAIPPASSSRTGVTYLKEVLTSARLELDVNTGHLESISSSVAPPVQTHIPPSRSPGSLENFDSQSAGSLNSSSLSPLAPSWATYSAQCATKARRASHKDNFVRIIPLTPTAQDADLGDHVGGRGFDPKCGDAPKRLLWSFFPCPALNTGLPGELIYNFLHRLMRPVNMSMSSTAPHAPNNNKTDLFKYLPTELFNKLSRMRVGATNTPTAYETVTTRPIAAAGTAGVKTGAEGAPAPVQAPAPGFDVPSSSIERSIDSILIVHDFMSWVHSIEGTYEELHADMAYNSKDHVAAVQKVSEAVVMVGEIIEEMSRFFMQIRSSDLIPVLLPLLQCAWSHYWHCRSSSTQVVDTRFMHSCNLFISYCWSQHCDSSVKMLMEMANEAQLDDDFVKAEACITRILEVDSSYIEAYVKRATIQFAQSKALDSLNTLEHAVSIFPLHFRALCGKAIILMKTRKYKSALALFARVLELNPTQQDSLSRHMQKCQREIATMDRM
jgi:hypothetical protein